MAVERLEDGTLLNGRYRILRALGSGGMGTVYLAEHLRLDTVVAVKEILGHTGNESQVRYDLDGCEREARFLVRLNHAHLPKVTDAFIENDRFYLVMEYIEGTTLEALLRDLERGPLNVGQVIDWGLQIADVLAYLHAQDPPIIFRDVKPANIMLQPDGEIRLIDFGIARRFQPGANKDTALLGSVGYSPPEQFGKHQTDARSDIYAFAATLHHLLTGRDPASQPFKFPPARSLNTAVPETLSRLLAACLSMEPDSRPSSIDEVARGLLAARTELAELPAAQTQGGVSPHPPSRRIVSSQLARYERRRRKGQGQSSVGLRRAALVVLALLVTGSATYALLHSYKPSPVHHPIKPGPMPNPMPEPVKPPHVDPNPPIVPPTDAPIVTLTVERITQDTGDDLLSVTVHSALSGHAGSVATVAVFVYGLDGMPLLAVDRSSTYANPDGQLSVATRLSVTTDQQEISVPLSLPLRQFPSPSLINPFKVRALITVDGQSFYSDMVIVNSLNGAADPNAAPGASAVPGGSAEPPINSGDGATLVPSQLPNGVVESGSGIVAGH